MQPLKGGTPENRAEAVTLCMLLWKYDEAKQCIEVIDAWLAAPSRWHPLLIFIHDAVLKPYQSLLMRNLVQDNVCPGAHVPMRRLIQWVTEPLELEPVRACMRFAAVTWGMPRHWIIRSAARDEAAQAKSRWACALRAVLLRLDQAKDVMWWFVRRFWVGASNLGAIFRMQDAIFAYCTPFHEWRTPVHVWREIVGIAGREAFPAFSMRAAAHGKTMEGMPRDMLQTILCKKGLDCQILEFGTMIVPYCGVYTQSPDGLVRSRLDAETHPWPALIEDVSVDPYQPHIAAYDNAVLSQCKALVEIKCHWIKSTCYHDWPDMYGPQIWQGMLAYNVPESFVVSLYYVPERNADCMPYGRYIPEHDKNQCQLMIQTIQNDSNINKWIKLQMETFAKFIYDAGEIQSALEIEPDVQAWHLNTIVRQGRVEKGTIPLPPWFQERTKLFIPQKVARWINQDPSSADQETKDAIENLGHLGPFVHLTDALDRSYLTLAPLEGFVDRRPLLDGNEPIDLEWVLSSDLIEYWTNVLKKSAPVHNAVLLLNLSTVM